MTQKVDMMLWKPVAQQQDATMLCGFNKADFRRLKNNRVAPFVCQVLRGQGLHIGQFGEIFLEFLILTFVRDVEYFRGETF